MTRAKKIFFVAAVTASAMFAPPAIQRSAAQFTMSTTGSNAEITVPIVVNPPGSIDFRVVNEAEARVMRKELWRRRNSVDFKITASGMATQFNKSWTTNNQNVVAAELGAYYYHTLTRDRYTSLFKFDGVYGMNHIDKIWFKNQDMLKLYYLSSWKLRREGLLRHWAYSFSVSFASQFSEGFKSRTEKIVWSNFMAPGTLNAGLGLTYTSPEARLPFIVTIDPVSMNALFVMDNNIDDERRQKLGIALPGDAVAGQFLYTQNRHKIEGGSNLNVAFNRTFTFGKKMGFTLQYNTTLTSFYGWITQVAKPSGAGTERSIVPTVGWTNALSINPLKFLALEFRTTTLYDRSQVDKVQMQYYVRVGLTYRYKNR